MAEERFENENGSMSGVDGSGFNSGAFRGVDENAAGRQTGGEGSGAYYEPGNLGGDYRTSTDASAGAGFRGGAGVPGSTGYGTGTGASAGAGYGSSTGASAGTGYGTVTGYRTSAGASAGAGYGSSTGASAGAGYGTGTGASAGAGYGSSTGTSAGTGYGTGTGTSAGAGYGTGAGASAGAGYGTGAGASAGAGYGTGAGTAGGAGYGNAAGVPGGTGEGYTANGRYYSYGGRQGTPGGSGNGVGNGGRSASGKRSSGRKKNRKVLGIVLAVILVFVIGAGAGAFISGRSTASISENGSPLQEKKEASSGTGKKEGSDESSEAYSSDGKKVSGSTGEGSSITRVADADKNTGSSSVSDDDSVADVAALVMPSIVSVYNKYIQTGQFFGQTYTQEAESTGSGIIIEETEDELLIVTNNHVVEGAESLSVQFIDEENCEAALKGTDSSSDLAVISVKLENIPADTKKKIAIAELGDSDTLRIGERAIAIGNALGYGQSLTVGYISALNREITSENGITGTFIQTDAAINPGNSGGALLNKDGQVIGINSNKIGGEAVESMGFAIPISKAIPIIEELKLQESRTKVAEEDQGMLGIHGITVTSNVASAYGLPVGAYVEAILEGSGAAESDLRAGDVITGLDGQSVTSMEDLQRLLAYYEAGREVTLTVQHPLEGGEYEEREIKVKLSRRSDFSSESNGREGRSRSEQQENDFFESPFGSFGF